MRRQTAFVRMKTRREAVHGGVQIDVMCALEDKRAGGEELPLRG
jgi:hypothetical protein